EAIDISQQSALSQTQQNRPAAPRKGSGTPCSCFWAELAVQFLNSQKCQQLNWKRGLTISHPTLAKTLPLSPCKVISCVENHFSMVVVKGGI
ncbi:hypothetical protein CEXT_295111, partial [Caerostris extrusa]